MYGGRPGSIATFSFRLLLAELPMHCGKPKESMDRLFELLGIIRQILGNLKQGFCEDGNPAEICLADRNDSLKLWSGMYKNIYVAYIFLLFFILEHFCSLLIELIFLLDIMYVI